MPSERASTFRLYLVRHAHAGWPAAGMGDFERELDALGRAEARDIAEQALISGFRPERLICSPAARCKQTAAAFLDVFRSLEPLEDAELYSGGTDAYLDQIKRNQDAGSLMLVGHNPMMEALAHHLSRESQVTAPIAMGYPTAGLLALDFLAPLPAKLVHAGQPVALIIPSSN